ncbi:MAG: hypothetical protein LBI70_03795 [Rickettsiales bacterium]|jgi:hypothetical protein|nr:hypothetical protein [Rickettsiales bacterium]
MKNKTLLRLSLGLTICTINGFLRSARASGFENEIFFPNLIYQNENIRITPESPQIDGILDENNGNNSIIERTVNPMTIYIQNTAEPSPTENFPENITLPGRSNGTLGEEIFNEPNVQIIQRGRTFLANEENEEEEEEETERSTTPAPSTAVGCIGTCLRFLFRTAVTAMEENNPTSQNSRQSKKQKNSRKSNLKSKKNNNQTKSTSQTETEEQEETEEQTETKKSEKNTTSKKKRNRSSSDSNT